MNRRKFLSTSAKALLLAAAPTPVWAAQRASKFRWSMVLTWTREMDLLTKSAIRFAKQVSLLSESRLAIDVSVAPKEMPPQLIMDQVIRGEAHCTHALASSLPQAPIWQWFGQVPFGMTAQQFSAWLEHDGGTLFRRSTRDFGLHARPMGNIGPMGFAWSKRPLHTLNDLKELSVAADGTTAKALHELGAHPVSIRHEHRGRALKTGKLDAASCLGTHTESAFGLPAAAPHHTLPGWQAPSTPLFLFVNKQAYERIPAILRRILDTAAQEEHQTMQSIQLHANATAEQRNRSKGIAPTIMPSHALTTIQKITDQYLADSAVDADSRAVRDSYRKTHFLYQRPAG